MQERTRYRVTGSLFLLALVVIFVPMLFDGPRPPVAPIPTQPPTQISTPTIPPFDEVVPDTDVVAQVEQLRAEVDEEGFDRAHGTRFGEPILNETQAGTEVWAVQAGSFAKASNAQGFRDQLRAEGFEAFISTAKNSQQQVIHRVAVGPMLDQQAANRVVEQISQQFAVQARLVEMTQ